MTMTLHIIPSTFAFLRGTITKSKRSFGPCHCVIRGLRGGTSRKKIIVSADADRKKYFELPRNETSQLLNDSANFLDLQSPAMLEDQWTTELYPKTVLQANDPTRQSFRPPSVDPELTSVILFPGQGSQFIGMGAELLKRNVPNVKRLFEGAGHILGYDLEKLCLEGPSKQLNRTVHCQPAIFVCSIAAIERLKQEDPLVSECSFKDKMFFGYRTIANLFKAVENCIATAGFSVGEYAALVFAGSLSFEDALKIVKLRAEAMQRASEAVSSGLLTVFVNFKSNLSLAIAGAKQWVKEQKGYEPVCSVANYLFTECKVIGGEEEALQFIENNASKFNFKCKRIPVSGAFHTALMRPAADELRAELSKFKISPPLINVHSNLDGKPYSQRRPDDIARKLIKQIYLPVRWEQTIHLLYDRDFFAEKFPRTFECGPGNHLGIMLRRTHARAYQNYHCFFDKFDEIEKYE